LPRRRHAHAAAEARSRRFDGDRPRRRSRGVRWGRVALVALACAATFALAFWISLPSAAPLRRGHPPSTALIDDRVAEARAAGKAPRRIQQWVPLERISPWLQDAVVNSEDARFYLHHGVDEVELNLALQRAMDEGHLGRGASTLTQQLAKNLWLGEDRSLLRKAKEYVLAERLERLGKDRILELYLNVVEWGNGIYGAEAAARTWFGKPAAALSPEESAVLAAMLPAPRKRNPRKPSYRLRVRAFQVLSLYGMYKQLSPVALADARGRLQGLIGPR
jgi:monofunctional biosynthetic peptidoglycan transglycosylase